MFCANFRHHSEGRALVPNPLLENNLTEYSASLNSSQQILLSHGLNRHSFIPLECPKANSRSNSTQQHAPRVHTLPPASCRAALRQEGHPDPIRARACTLASKDPLQPPQTHQPFFLLPQDTASAARPFLAASHSKASPGQLTARLACFTLPLRLRAQSGQLELHLLRLAGEAA